MVPFHRSVSNSYHVPSPGTPFSRQGFNWQLKTLVARTNEKDGTPPRQESSATFLLPPSSVCQETPHEIEEPTSNTLTSEENGSAECTFIILNESESMGSALCRTFCNEHYDWTRLDEMLEITTGLIRFAPQSVIVYSRIRPDIIQSSSHPSL